MKTVVLGFDGLSARFLDRFSDSLPTLSALRERGVETPLESTLPASPRSVWPSLYTGTDPSHHGVYGAPAFDGYPDEPTPVSRIDVRRPALWDYLSSRDVPSIALAAPLTNPADPLCGVLVPGDPALEDEPAYPRGTRADLSAALGEEYVISPLSEDGNGGVGGSLDPLEAIDQRRRAFLTLLETHEWELGICRIGATDAAAWDVTSERRLRSIYGAADRFVGDVLEFVDGDTNVVVCSPFGTRPVSGYRVHVNELLRARGFLGAEPHRGRRASSALGADSRTPFGWTLAPLRFLTSWLESLASRLRPGSRSPEDHGRFDWSQSLAYAPPDRSGVRLNLAGREPDGIVSSSSYGNAREELLETLTNLETPDGDPALGYVFQRDRVYDGPFLEAAPDVLFSAAGTGNVVSTLPSDRPFVPATGYDREPVGLFLGVGPGFADPEDVDRLAVPDVAPITMAVLGRGVPSLMTGTVPTDLVSTPVVRTAYPASTYGAAATDPSFDDAGLTERLEGLEYP